MKAQQSVISTTAELAALCGRLSTCPYVTVDTEFMRETTYWARLCLLQIAGGGEAVVVDPLVDGLDLAPFYELMSARGVVKVFHAARQDIEIFHHEGGMIPAPLFDTQVAAMVLGFGESVGYEKLIAATVGARIDKSSQFTDWSRRPLSDRQIAYALDDVVHLTTAYEKLRGRLHKSGREAWLDEEMAILTDPGTYAQEPEMVWRRIKTRNRNRRFLAVLRELAAWRERLARQRNVPRGRILRDDALLALAAEAPRDVASLGRVRLLPKNYGDREEAAAILEAVARAHALPEAELPVSVDAEDLPRGIGPLVELLKVLLKMKCDVYDVAQKLVATTSDLERIAADDEADVAALRGWRRELFGADALALKRGELALAAGGRQLKLLAVDAASGAMTTRSIKP